MQTLFTMTKINEAAAMIYFLCAGADVPRTRCLHTWSEEHGGEERHVANMEILLFLNSQYQAA